jgi:hypothetical protein
MSEHITLEQEILAAFKKRGMKVSRYTYAHKNGVQRWTIDIAEEQPPAVAKA